jgi:predicted XRE-type DNA-binding protein
MKAEDVLNNYTVVGECWEWKSALDSRGYGRVWFDGKVQKAHRVVYELVIGPIPEGEGPHGTCVCHACDNPKCIRPDHLFLGSNADNMRDRDEKGRAANQKGESNGNSKLTADQVSEIRRLYADGLTQQAIADRFGIGQQQVSRVVNGKRWTHLQE